MSRVGSDPKWVARLRRLLEGVLPPKNTVPHPFLGLGLFFGDSLRGVKQKQFTKPTSESCFYRSKDPILSSKVLIVQPAQAKVKLPSHSVPPM